MIVRQEHLYGAVIHPYCDCDNLRRIDPWPGYFCAMQMKTSRKWNPCMTACAVVALSRGWTKESAPWTGVGTGNPPDYKIIRLHSALPVSTHETAWLYA